MDFVFVVLDVNLSPGVEAPLGRGWARERWTCALGFFSGVGGGSGPLVRYREKTTSVQPSIVTIVAREAERSQSEFWIYNQIWIKG